MCDNGKKEFDEQLKFYKSIVVLTLRSSITIGMARRSVEFASNHLKNLKMNCQSRLSDPRLDNMKKDLGLNALNKYKWVLEANIMNNMTMAKKKGKSNK